MKNTMKAILILGVELVEAHVKLATTIDSLTQPMKIADVEKGRDGRNLV
jgi:hypothetical protein